ncbi:hypothetical protein ACLOJK_026368 [Asimina triloba]
MVKPNRGADMSMRPGEESDADSYRDTSSDGSSDSEIDRSKHVSPEAWGHHNLIDSSILRINRLTVRDKSQAVVQGGIINDDVGVSNPHGIPIFEYFERDTPYSRKPLADKASSIWLWTWYPIYRIPTGPTLRDLEACFLTFHSLSTPIRGSGNVWPLVHGPTIRKAGSAMDLSPTLSLPSFGLASYKFRGPVWTTTGVMECQQATLLLQAADNWLRLLQVEHPDFQFFVSHSTRLLPRLPSRGKYLSKAANINKIKLLAEQQAEVDIGCIIFLILVCYVPVRCLSVDGCHWVDGWGKHSVGSTEVNCEVITVA